MIESRDYAQVVFECVGECYTESQQLECFFTLSQLLKVEPTDFIGIFKVGFTNLKEYVLMKPINVELLTKEKKGKLVFEGQQLPKEDGEYYQFVYVSQGKLIRGASIPFQFKRSRVPGYVCVEETIVYKPRESQIIDTIDELRNKCDRLTVSNELYVKLLKENENMVKIMKDEVANMKLQGLKMAIEKMIPLERELLVKPEEIQRIQSELKIKENLVSELTHTLKLVVGERNVLNNQVVSLRKENVELRTSKVELTRDLSLNKDKLVSVEQTKEMIKGQLVHVTKQLEEVSRVSNKENELLVKLREQEKIHQQEKDHLLEIIKKMKEETKEGQQQLNGPYYALQVANNHLEKKINTTKQESCEQRQKIQELVEEIESLKDRLRQGAYEYTCLNRKYFRLMNLIEGSKIESEIKRELFNEMMIQPTTSTLEKSSSIKIQPTSTEYFSINEYPSLNIKYEQHYPTIPSCYKSVEIPRSSSQTIHKSWEPKSTITTQTTIKPTIPTLVAKGFNMQH